MLHSRREWAELESGILVAAADQKMTNEMLPGAESESRTWSEALKIKSYDVDFRRQITLESICRYFLEAAWNHAEALGVGFSQLAAAKRVWVLSRLLVQIHRYGAWSEQVLLRTWPRGRDSLFALRDFAVLGGEGVPLVGGTSSWLVLDANSRRPQRIDKVVGGIQTVSERATERDAEKLEPCPNDSPTQGSEAALPEMAIQVRYSDEDLNGHVNSARYVRWLLDTYPREWHQRHTVTQLEINYLGECRGGDEVRIASRPDGRLCFSHFISKVHGQEACRARIQWAAS